MAHYSYFVLITINSYPKFYIMLHSFYILIILLLVMSLKINNVIVSFKIILFWYGFTGFSPRNVSKVAVLLRFIHSSLYRWYSVNICFIVTSELHTMINWWFFYRHEVCWIYLLYTLYLINIYYITFDDLMYSYIYWPLWKNIKVYEKNIWFTIMFYLL